ncbi:hypothetical protein [Mycobacterium pseudokansasii]|uniref:Secreted protein n=2 Tax=Mycobacterium pseudokansasii TaxID=2341080 RepID=A0A498R2T7_9MYCO|nr:hypothetical protein [Mycobacterium pseudokansasii]VBA33713.1 hypothetical protein LAUMK35_05552 [Mycobacterium pseudokansasii]VBA35294.1 hypothetical protein LAUMK21_05512 [Mycobacterium pseudokansasii]VBA56371.1 hypothetical protein LAUMK142_05511 [Mycobacterium pseudokansasii]
MRRPIVVTLVLATLSAVGLATAEPSMQPMQNQGRYSFNQQHRDNLSWWNRTWVPQLIPKGALLEVQLPSDPIHWIPYGEPDCQPSPGWDWAEISGSWYPDGPPRHQRVAVELEGQHTVPNQNRYRESANPYELPGVYIPFDKRVDGSSTITIFDYHLLPGPSDDYWAGRGLATICLRPDPIPEDVRVLGFPPDTPPTYVLTLVVGVRQASYGGGLPPTPLPLPPMVSLEPDGPSAPPEPPAEEHG